MFKNNTPCFFLIILFVSVLAGCAPAQQKDDFLAFIHKRILIISGETLNSVVGDSDMIETLLDSSSKFSSDLRGELNKRGAAVIERINNVKEKSTGTIIGETLAGVNFDAVIKVSLTQKKNRFRDEISLDVNYLPVEWFTDASGNSAVKMGEGLAKSYKGISENKISQIASDYTKFLIWQRAL